MHMYTTCTTCTVHVLSGVKECVVYIDKVEVHSIVDLLPTHFRSKIHVESTMVAV